MKFCVLASGSKGNTTYIETSNHRILIDIGITCINVERRLKSINVEPSTIDTVLITHAHTDHVSGLPVFLKKYHPNVYITAKIEKEANLKLENPHYIDHEEYLDTTHIIAFKTSHDTEDSNGYIVEEGDSSIVYVTDTGYVNERNHALLKNRSAYVFESNHDVEKLMNNPNYPHQTKIRILSDRGHLSNVDASYYLAKFIGNKTKVVVLAHLSEQNNTPELAYQTLIQELKTHQVNFEQIKIASQNEPTEVFTI